MTSFRFFAIGYIFAFVAGLIFSLFFTFGFLNFALAFFITLFISFSSFYSQYKKLEEAQSFNFPSKILGYLFLFLSLFFLQRHEFLRPVIYCISVLYTALAGLLIEYLRQRRI